MDAARREAVSRATRLAGNGPVLAKRRNKANDRFTPRPKGASQVTWHSVAALEKDMPFPAGLRLVPGHLGRSVTINP
jgi:hypothetical protein